jgi:membrane-associated HD superfamily phosphohydrolase
LFQIVSYAQDVDFNLLHTVVLLLVVHTTISVTSIVCTASTNFYVHKDSGLTHNVTVVTLASVSMLFDVVLCKWYACRLMKFRNVIQFKYLLYVLVLYYLMSSYKKSSIFIKNLLVYYEQD